MHIDDHMQIKAWLHFNWNSCPGGAGALLGWRALFEGSEWIWKDTFTFFLLLCFSSDPSDCTDEKQT